MSVQIVVNDIFFVVNDIAACILIAALNTEFLQIFEDRSFFLFPVSLLTCIFLSL